MVGEIRYFFVHHISHMDYSGIEPWALFEYPPTKTLSQAANAVPRQPKDRTRFQELFAFHYVRRPTSKNRLFYLGLVVDSVAREQDSPHSDNLDFPFQLCSTFIYYQGPVHKAHLKHKLKGSLIRLISTTAVANRLQKIHCA
jgi:hypothetical protein